MTAGARERPPCCGKPRGCHRGMVRRPGHQAPPAARRTGLPAAVSHSSCARRGGREDVASPAGKPGTEISAKTRHRSRGVWNLDDRVFQQLVWFWHSGMRAARNRHQPGGGSGAGRPAMSRIASTDHSNALRPFVPPHSGRWREREDTPLDPWAAPLRRFKGKSARPTTRMTNPRLHPSNADRPDRSATTGGDAPRAAFLRPPPARPGKGGGPVRQDHVLGSSIGSGPRRTVFGPSAGCCMLGRPP